ncbi:MAG: VWA domain-containing protein [Acidobacteriales bacterium]|nr:VWA domain-containing protein [Terriglobales bacterium]
MKLASSVFCVALLSLAAVAQVPDAPSAVKTAKPQAPPPTPVEQKPEPPQPAAPSAPPPAAPQEPAAQNPVEPRPSEQEMTPEETISVRVREANFVFSVFDKRGRYIKDLKKENFSVLDNRQRVSGLTSFTSESNLPLRVGVMVDASTSVRGEFKFEQEAAVEFLNQIVKQRDQAFVISFDDTPHVEQDFTNNTERLTKAVHQIRPGGGTALFDAIYWVSRDLIMKKQERTSVRRAIILLSDGDDTTSRVTRTEAIEMAQRAEVIIYAINTETGTRGGQRGKNSKILEAIAEATGGKVFYPFRVEELANAFNDIQDELRSQYSLSFKPLTADGTFHSIDIIPSEKKYRVRTRKGYFAPGAAK